MPPCPRSAVALCTDVCASADIAATARRTGLVTRAAQRTGTLLLALVPCGAWRDATTTLAPLAARATPWAAPVEGAPDALPQRLPQRARALLQAMRRQARATGHARAHGGAAGLLPAWPKGALADRPGCGLPDSVSALLPASGGSAPNAGAHMPAGWA
jgi:hypothetical protein